MKRIRIYKCSKNLLIEEKNSEVQIGQCVVIGNKIYIKERDQ